MSLLQVLMIAGVIPAVVTWLLHFLSGKGLGEEGCVYMPKGFLLVGLFCGLLCIVLTVCSVLLKLGITWQVLQISSAVLTLVCFLAYCSLNIRYDRETFKCRTFFFQKRYRYSDIRGVVFGASESYTLVMTKGKVHVDGMTVGGQQFLDYAEERYRETGLGTIPEIQSQIFHGNVVEPLPKIILVCLPGIWLTVLAVWCLTEWSSIRIPENLQEEKMVLSFSGKQEEFLYFSSKGRKLQIDENAVESYDELESAISQNRTLNIIYDRIDEETLKIWGISDYNAVYVSPPMVYAAEVKSGMEGVLICWAAAVGYWLFVAFFCYILNHAEKYPRIAMLLIKKDDLNI